MKSAYKLINFQRNFMQFITWLKWNLSLLLYSYEKDKKFIWKLPMRNVEFLVEINHKYQIMGKMLKKIIFKENQLNIKVW